MDDGLIQFLIIAVFIIVSMMDAAARKRRKQAQSLERLAEPNRLSEAADDLDQAAESSEGMVPADPWEEITALARGEVPGPGVGSAHGPATRELSLTGDRDPEQEAWNVPQQEMPQLRTSAQEAELRAGRSMESFDRPDAFSPTESRAADLQGGYLHPDQAAAHEEHAHEKHAEVAVAAQTLPSERPHEFVPHSPEAPGKPRKEPSRARQTRSLLSGVREGTRNSLREAIVLAEVLSPPVTLRDSGWKPLF